MADRNLLNFPWLHLTSDIYTDSIYLQLLIDAYKYGILLDISRKLFGIHKKYITTEIVFKVSKIYEMTSPE